MKQDVPSRTPLIELLLDALRHIEARGEGDYEEPPADAFAKVPPSWACDPFNGDCADQCGYCGAWCSVVRPGKTQCDVCWDGRNLKYIARRAIATATGSQP